MNKLMVWQLSLGMLLVAIRAGAASGPVVDGVELEGSVHDGWAYPRAAEGGTPDFIHFDGSPAPCIFVDTSALTDEFSVLGVTFSGPGGNDGGAVLDQCGGFGVTGHSPPNFLAFNTGVVYPNGGVPQGPETLSFFPAVNGVQIQAGHSSAGTITLECSDGLGMFLGSSTVLGASELQSLSVLAAGIESCILTFTGSVAVFDDLAVNKLIFNDGFESGDTAMWSHVVP